MSRVVKWWTSSSNLLWFLDKAYTGKSESEGVLVPVEIYRGDRTAVQNVWEYLHTLLEDTHGY